MSPKQEMVRNLPLGESEMVPREWEEGAIQVDTYGEGM